jgi:hypothetical protein
MSIRDPEESRAFAPVRLGPRRRRIDPFRVGLTLALVALAVVILKPWAGVPGIAAVFTPTPSSPSPAPIPSSTLAPLAPPTWADVRSVVTRREAWGIRTIVAESAASASPSTRAPGRFAEHWVSVGTGDGADRTALVARGAGDIVALGITFPPAETPLDVRVWLDHDGGELEWMDALPVDAVPAHGAYLFVRRSAVASVLPWAPGRYRIDVLVGGGIKRIDAEIPDPSGKVPPPDPWLLRSSPVNLFDASGLAALPVGLFAQADGATQALASIGGRPLDETGAWLDVGPSTRDPGGASFLATTYLPGVTRLGVRLPAGSTITGADVRRVAPFDEPVGLVRTIEMAAGVDVPYAAFVASTDAPLRPGVYALSVSWRQADGSHEATWHVELRPGPIGAEPVLLSATRSWARFAGSSGILLGSTDPLDGTTPEAGLRLLDIAPPTGTQYPGLSGSNLIGCGSSIIRGRPTLIGIVAQGGTNLAPVVARILYPLADTGPVGVLTASGSVPGLILISPVITAEFGGPAAYGFRAGPGGNGPGYTICVGFAIGAR